MTDMECDSQPWLLPQRTYDRFIMEEISQLPNVTPMDLKYAQCCRHCRLFLGITTLTDITTSDGKTIAEWTLTHGLDNPRPSPLLYPNQIRPNSTVWKVF